MTGFFGVAGSSARRARTPLAKRAVITTAGIDWRIVWLLQESGETNMLAVAVAELNTCGPRVRGRRAAGIGAGAHRRRQRAEPGRARRDFILGDFASIYPIPRHSW